MAIPKEILQYILKGAKPVVVENKNDGHYNLALAEKGYLFLPASNNREVFLTIKADRNMLGLRDRDYLKEAEIAAIKKLYPNYRILKFYAFENYLYHPDNLAELAPAGFNRDAYVTDLTASKNNVLPTVVAEIGTARQHYVEFKEGLSNDGKIEEMIAALKSDALADFYPFFNVKKYYNKQYLQSFNLTPATLVKTAWFKASIEAALNT